MTQQNYLNTLNEAQRDAVLYCDGPSLVIAGAGSGKTRVLVHKLIHLLHIGYSPDSLMVLTFTNKAAREMRERIYRAVGVSARNIKMGTFHSVFSSILRLHAHELGFTKDFTIYDTNDSRSRIRSIVKELKLDDKKYTPQIVLRFISRAKNDLVLPQIYLNSIEMRKRDQMNNLPELGKIYSRYQRSLKESNAMDFDDLLLMTNILFRDFPEILEYWQEKIDYLLIDEYQDTNLAQYMIAQKLVATKHKIFVVGDDAQSIYAFRGANIQNILNFGQNFDDAKIFKLEQNYRSTQNIVNAANALIGNNRHQHVKKIFSLLDEGEKIELYKAFSGDLEAIWVASRINAIIKKEQGSYNDFAILYRNNAQSRSLEQALRKEGIPFRIWGGFSFFSYKEIMDIVAYLRLIVNQNDDEALLRIINYPKRGIGDTTIDKVKDQSRKLRQPIYRVIVEESSISEIGLNKGVIKKIGDFVLLIEQLKQKVQDTQISLYEKVEQIIHQAGIYHDLMQDNTVEGKQRQDNMQELISSVEEYTNIQKEMGRDISLAGYVNEIALYTDQDKKEADTPCVTLMTIHAAKGLEFPHVFIVGVEENTFPSSMSLIEPNGIEEERRLMYVALTRAEKSCHISYAMERFRYGKLEATRASRFLRELPTHLLCNIDDNIFGQIRIGSNQLPTTFQSFDISPQQSKPINRKVVVSRRVKNIEEAKHDQIGNFKIGTRVTHAIFGDGTIVVLEGDGDNAKATVEFDINGRKKLLLKFAKLTLI